jgi:hypothetical protein
MMGCWYVNREGPRSVVTQSNSTASLGGRWIGGHAQAAAWSAGKSDLWFAWCRVGCPAMTQKWPLVSRARVGLGGVAGGGLTHWGDSYTFCLRPQFSSGLGAPLDKLGPVGVTTLGGAFHCACVSAETKTTITRR